MIIDRRELEFFEEAMSHEHKNKRAKAMRKEMKSLNENRTYNLVNLPKRKKALKNKWVYRLKIENNL